VDNDGQGAMAQVLHFNVVEGEQAQAIAKRLVKRLEEDHYRHKVGFVCMNALLSALTKYGYSNVLYKSIVRYDYPSYGYWKNQGATSLWERWSGAGDGGESRNHHMYGSVLSWLLGGVAGIQNTGVGYDTCQLKPLFFADTCYASGKTATPRGELAFAWEKTNEKFSATVILPKDTRATLILPNGHTMYLTKSENIEINL
jgi:alpha-L-rhamnosidase